MSIELVMPPNHLIFCRPLLLLPSIFPSIRVFSNESALRIRWSKYWSFSFSISPSNEHPGLISFRMDWLDLLAVQGLSRAFSNTAVRKHQLFGAQPSLWSSSHVECYHLIIEVKSRAKIHISFTPKSPFAPLLWATTDLLSVTHL